MTKTAVVLFNLGGPDSPEAVEPFLFNLFNDPAIIGVPQPIRWALARFIAKRRGPTARAIYDELGGKSPLLEMTEAQAHAITEALGDRLTGNTVRTFIAMRYWHPMSVETAERVRDFGPDRVVLLPLYPQFSTTTVESSLSAWSDAARDVGLSAPTVGVCCYPVNDGWIAAQADLIAGKLETFAGENRPRILFSAHGLPKKIVDKGDPYQWQVERTAEAVVETVRDRTPAVPEFDWQVCYQSRVGPLEWIGPATEDEIKRAGSDGVPLVVVPIAFVSEHSETLVELDIEYGKLAGEAGVPAYERVAAVGTHPAFIRGLADLVVDVLARESGEPTLTVAGCPDCRCPPAHRRCPQQKAGAGA